MTTDRCLCTHPESDHEEGGTGRCSPVDHPACGCREFRPAGPGDEAEAWLQAREAAAQSAPREGAA